jgi:hypothetical protein
MNRLRAAIIADVSEDMQAIEELSEWHRELVDAFNAAGPFPGYPEVEPITDADIDGSVES